jgi:hypothetical protein
MEDGMNQNNTNVAGASSCYEQVGRRFQRMVSDPNVQKHQAVTITRRADEALEAWDRILQELDETDGITVERLDLDSVRIGWKRYVEF